MRKNSVRIAAAFAVALAATPALAQDSEVIAQRIRAFLEARIG